MQNLRALLRRHRFRPPRQAILLVLIVILAVLQTAKTRGWF